MVIQFDAGMRWRISADAGRAEEFEDNVVLVNLLADARSKVYFAISYQANDWLILACTSVGAGVLHQHWVVGRTGDSQLGSPFETSLITAGRCPSFSRWRPPDEVHTRSRRSLLPIWCTETKLVPETQGIGLRCRTTVVINGGLIGLRRIEREITQT